MALSDVSALLGCASTTMPNAPATGSCSGTVAPPPAGLAETRDPALLSQAIGAPLAGKLCSGKVFKAAADSAGNVAVYRVWDASRPCTLKAGAEIVVGPGQSAKCSDDLSYPPSPVNQVFIPNDARNQQVWVENCGAGEDSPSP